MDEKKAKMMSILEKMLRLAMDSGATEGEKEVAERKASEIMAKYKIHRSELTLQDKSDPDAGMGRNFCSIIDKNAKWIITLISSLTQVFECRPLVHQGYRKQVNGIEVFGEQDDVETVVEMFNRIELRITQELWRELGQNAGLRRSRKFCQGATDRVCFRLLKMYRRIQSDNVQCRDLVIVKSQRAQVFLDRTIGPTYEMKDNELSEKTSRHDKEYIAGVIAGNKIDLGNTRKGQRIDA